MYKLLTIFIFLSLVNAVPAFIIYIPQDYPTIQDGIYAASSGDTISVSSGIFPSFLYSGSILQDLHIIGSGAWGDQITSIRDSISEQGVYLDNVTGWEIANFDIREFSFGILIENCHELDIHNNYIQNSNGWYIAGVKIECCTDVQFHHNLLIENHFDGMNINFGNLNLMISNNNILYTSGYNGINVYYETFGMVVVNNIIAYNSDNGVLFFPGTPQGDASLIFNDNFGNFGDNWENCIPGVGNISEDPLFTEDPTCPYTLLRSSPCIDAGDPNSPLDPDGTRADIGVFYFDQRPPAIEDLTVSVSDSNIVLDWSDVAQASIYYIYKSNQPYFNSSGMIPSDSALTSEYIDWDSAGQERQFYQVTSAYNN